MDILLPFVSLVLLSTGLGIDNGLLIEFSLKSLNLERRQHLIWRSVTLILAALLRVVFLFSLSRLAFLNNNLPAYSWLPNRWFSKHPEHLTWMSLVLFAGGLIILAMALWEYYHKLRETMGSEHHDKSTTKTGTLQILIVVAYLAGMNILFSLDSVLAAVAGGGHLVPGPFGDELPFKLGEREQHVQHQPAHGAGRVELLGDRDEGDLVPLEDLHDAGEVQQTATEPVDLVDHHAVDPPAPHIFEELPQGGPLHVAAGVAAVIVAVGQTRPALLLLAGDVALARLALRVERVKLPVEPLLGALAGIHPTADGWPFLV